MTDYSESLGRDMRAMREAGAEDTYLQALRGRVPDIPDEQWTLLEKRWEHEGRVASGLATTAEIREFEAWWADQVHQLDLAAGTADATYFEFRDAFERGADCPELFEIRNRMHPKDPLKLAANEDLRSVKCYMSHSKRQEPTEQA